MFIDVYFKMMLYIPDSFSLRVSHALHSINYVPHFHDLYSLFEFRVQRSTRGFIIHFM